MAGPCSPLLYKGREDRPAILLIHGFTGGPHDMHYLAQGIADQGFTVSVPRLPGHGTNGDDFIQSSAKQWLRHSIDSYLDLRRTNETVLVGGLSMGGVLALLLAAQFPVEGLMLFAPALVVSNPLIGLSKLIGSMIPRTRHVPRVDEEAEPELQEIQRQYGSFTWIRQGGELYRLQRMCRKSLGHITADTMMVLSQQDITVPLRSGEIIKRRINAKQLDYKIYTQSGHVITNGIEKEKALADTLEWLSKRV
ncbi:hypothetical protein DC28_00645 [Spirochaeta lutea]|uniref:Serine aminopeptidase S33 domain-containing protein n=1 Tax=Spirochaeta lutea TaxID=1480694 RepID=A0A098R4U1_9SPIO|nr:hypothetical protein DC28_00645 [Spirochaeta lutea]